MMQKGDTPQDAGYLLFFFGIGARSPLLAIHPGDLPRLFGGDGDTEDALLFRVVDRDGVGVTCHNGALTDQGIPLVRKVKKIGCAARNMARGGN